MIGKKREDWRHDEAEFHVGFIGVYFGKTKSLEEQLAES